MKNTNKKSKANKALIANGRAIYRAILLLISFFAILWLVGYPMFNKFGDADWVAPVGLAIACVGGYYLSEILRWGIWGFLEFHVFPIFEEDEELDQDPEESKPSEPWFTEVNSGL